MERKITLLFLLFFLLIPLHRTSARDVQSLDINSINAELDYELVYLDEEMCQTILRLKYLLPDYEWSTRFRNLHFDIEDEGNVALYEQVDAVINESLVACRKLPQDILGATQASLEEYQALLHAGRTHVTYEDNDISEQELTRGCCSSSKVKKICKLSVGCLSVTGKLFVNGVDFSLLTDIVGAVGATGPEGAQGIAGALGAIGAAGPAGAQGIAGVLGAIGAAGPAGAQGIAGVLGAVGATGPAGAQGIAGVLGAVGAAGPTGAQGIAGVLGAVGAAGPAGAQGIAGVIGAIGAAGAAGAAGAPGVPGAPGAQGIPGLPGVGGVLGYGYIYNVTPIASVGLGAAIPFDSNGLLAGIAHIPLSSAITVVTAGTYVVTFSVSGTNPGQFGIYINGAVDPLVTPSTIYGSGAGTQQDTGQAILALGAGDSISIVNVSGIAQILAPNIGGPATTVNASVVILRLT